MTPGDPRSFKRITTLNVSSLSADQQASMEKKLDAAVYEASAGYPAVSQYFVKHVPEDSEIAIGLKIDRVNSDKVQGIANALIDASIEAACNGDSDERPVAEESFLVLTE